MPPDSSFLSLAVLASTLECGAGRTRPFGFFSAAVAAYLPLARLSPAGAAAVAGAALAVRTLTRGSAGAGGGSQKNWDVRGRELLCDLLPVGAAVAVPALLPAHYSLIVAALVWGLLARLLPPKLAAGVDRSTLLSWYPIFQGLHGMRLAVALVGLGLSLVRDPLAVWLFFPILWGSQRGAELVCLRTSAERADQAQEDLARSEEERRLLGERLAGARHEIEGVVEERRLLEEFTILLARGAGVAETANLIRQTAARILPFRSMAIFAPREGRLTPVYFATPERQKVESADLLQLTEPLVEACWRRRTVLRSGPDFQRGPRLFEKEHGAVALPLQEEGVLYVGREGVTDYSDEQVARLALVAGLASLVLQSTRRRRAEQEGLAQRAEAGDRLQQWVDWLEALLEGARALATTLDPDELVEHLERQVARTIPHGLGCVLYGGPAEPTCKAWGQGKADESALRELAGAVMSSGKPLLLEDIGQSRFVAPAALKAWLCVPLLKEYAGQKGAGAICLGAAKAGAFDRTHQDLLSIIAFHWAAALANSELFRAAVEARRELVQSSKMAAIGQLAAGIAHELNTPLGSIALSLDMAGRAQDPAKRQQRLSKAASMVERIKNLVGKLLYYSRVSQTGMHRCDINIVVADTLELLAHPLSLEGVRVETFLGEVPEVMANPNEMQQVISNLLLNAKDALQELPDEERVIVIETLHAEGQVLVSVSDRGCGIAPEDQSRILEPFFTTKPVGKGTGLGLSVSQQICQAHQADLSFTSVAGEGTTFTIRLPALSVESGG